MWSTLCHTHTCIKKGEGVEKEENILMFGEREHTERANIHSQSGKENTHIHTHTKVKVDTDNDRPF